MLTMVCLHCQGSIVAGKQLGVLAFVNLHFGMIAFGIRFDMGEL